MMTSTADYSDLAATGLSRAGLDRAIDRHERAALPKLRLLWAYYRNPMSAQVSSVAAAAGGVTSRAWRLAQERGLPPRLLGGPRPGVDDRAWGRKEIVIENDIAWRVHAMVDFMFGQRVGIFSTARDPDRRAAIDRVLEAVWDESGGIALMQDMALMGNVFGFVDLVVRAATTAATTSTGDEASGGGEGGEGTAPREEAIERRARRGVRVELIEPTRGVALAHPDDPKRLLAYIIRTRRADPAAAGVPARERLGPWRRALSGLGINAQSPRTGAAPGEEVITEVIGPRESRTYRTDDDAGMRLIGARPSLVNPRRTSDEPPIVHIQNLSQPFVYEGLSEVEPLIPLQDELNTRLSDRASRVTLQSFRMYLAKGLDNAERLPAAPGTIWSTDNPDAQITPFGGDTDAPSEGEHIEQIREAMDKQSGVPPLASGVVRAKIGNLTSENALKVTLMGLLSKTARKRVAYGRGIARASALVLEALDAMGVLATTPDERGVRVEWPDPLPKDERQALQAAQLKLELGLPRERVLADLGMA